MPRSLVLLALLTVPTAAALVASEPGLPDPLVCLDGTAVGTPELWTGRRRGELIELFSREVYGRAPIERPAGMTCTVTETTPGMMDGAATRKRVRIAWPGPDGRAGGGIDVVLFVPAKRAAPAGCFLLICNRGADNIDPTRAKRTGFWPAETVVARGYAAAAFQVADLAPDKDDGCTSGVFATFDPAGKPRAADAWGTIAAWAWGASRVVDYLVTDPDLDPARIAVIGHSRGGKTALWCGSRDQRVALTISNDSGSTGAALARGKGGEDIRRINTVFPHWFCANYKHWNSREAELPVDQHELIALCAPRLVCVASASEDANADPQAEFRACVAASPVWTLLGQSGLVGTAMPPPEHPLQDGRLGYHLRTGKHDLTAYDWDRYLDFADKHLGR